MKSEVERHYDEISEDYDKNINLYCQKRFFAIVKKFSKGKVLEVGCGTGLIQNKLKGVVGVDITLSMLEKNKNDAVCADAHSIPFKDGIFDAVYSIDVIEHVKNPGKMVDECRRVLKKNGTLVLITPNGDMEVALDIAEKLKLKLPEGPHKFLRFGELVNLAKKYDFEILSAERFVLFPKEFWPVTRMFENLEKILPYFCLFSCVVARKIS
ncbi:MAG: methyltransferase domain-containing protein [Nanoarchaeota archaeon]|nr:methyltransferase domain-containing protein [Nanoarchaeota archaeon]